MIVVFVVRLQARPSIKATVVVYQALLKMWCESGVRMNSLLFQSYRGQRALHTTYRRQRQMVISVSNCDAIKTP